MLTARHVLPAADWDPASVSETITLDYEARYRRRFRLVTDGGEAFLLDLPRPVLLQEKDGLPLSDGRIVRVRAAEEDLVEVTADSRGNLLRLAWHIGNRHLPAELRGDAIRLRDDHVINHMLEGLGATVRKLRASFTPEAGAYSSEGGHGHSHGHSHGSRDHGHSHHDHDHAHHDRKAGHDA